MAVNDAQGYYSLVQYAEYPERAEFVNVGVALFSRPNPHVLSMFARSPRRIDAAFHVQRASFLKEAEESLERRLAKEFSADWTLERVELFARQRLGKLRMLPPRSVLSEDPVGTLKMLFGQLVDDKPRKARKEYISRKLRNELLELGVESLLERPSPVELSQGVTLRAPYAYQNCRYNFISGVSLTKEPDVALESASAQAIKGAWLWDDTALPRLSKLIVVADVDGQEDGFVKNIRDMMQDHRVGFYRLSEVAELANDIRKNYTFHRG
jgi:hypothetical protein